MARIRTDDDAETLTPWPIQFKACSQGGIITVDDPLRFMLVQDPEDLSDGAAPDFDIWLHSQLLLCAAATSAYNQS